MNEARCVKCHRRQIVPIELYQLSEDTYGEKRAEVQTKRAELEKRRELLKANFAKMQRVQR